jgi:hypothetical protein
MAACDDVLRRRFIVTDRFDADGMFAALEVVSEVTTMRSCSAPRVRREAEPRGLPPTEHAPYANQLASRRRL